MAIVAGEEAARTPRFAKTRNDAAELDERALARARRLVGLNPDPPAGCGGVSVA